LALVVISVVLVFDCYCRVSVDIRLDLASAETIAGLPDLVFAVLLTADYSYQFSAVLTADYSYQVSAALTAGCYKQVSVEMTAVCLYSVLTEMTVACLYSVSVGMTAACLYSVSIEMCLYSVSIEMSAGYLKIRTVVVSDYIEVSDPASVALAWNLESFLLKVSAGELAVNFEQASAVVLHAAVYVVLYAAVYVVQYVDFDSCVQVFAAAEPEALQPALPVSLPDSHSDELQP